MNNQILRRKKTSTMLCILLTICLVFTFTPASVSAEEVGAVKVDPTIEYQSMDGWGTSICWWGNTVGTWVGATNEKSIAYGLSLDPPVAGMTVRDAIIHMMFSPDGLNMNMARFCVGGGDKDEYANTTIRRVEAMVPGWSIDIYGDSNSNNGGQILPGFFSKPIRQMNDYGQLYVLQQAAKIRQEACAKEGRPSDFVVEVFSNSPPAYMTESGFVTGAYGVNMSGVETWPYSAPGSTGNADNLVKDQDMSDFAAYMAAAAKYMDNVLEPYGANVDMVNPFNEPGTRYWGCDHGGNMYKQEGCNVTMGEPQDRMLRKMRAALDTVGLQDTFLTMGETDFGNTINGYNQFAQDVKDMVPLIGTHAYDNESAKVKGSNDVNRVYLRDLAKSQDKTLWQVELGQGNGSFITGAMDGARTLSKSINRDLKTMQTSAWMDWNPLEPLYDSLSVNTSGVWSLGGWGLMAVNSNSTAYGIEGVKGVAMHGKPAGPYPRQSQASLFENNNNTGTYPPKTALLESAGWGDFAYKEGKSYYAHMQYSRFIKQGYTQIDIGNDYMVGFVSPDRKELVIVAYTMNNTSAISNSNASLANINALNTTVDLTAFPGANVAEVYRTTAGTSATAWGDSCAKMANQDVSSGILNVNLAANQVYTYVVKNSADTAIYAKDRSYELVNSEVVCTDSAKYSPINKFQYAGTWTEETWHESFPTDPFTLKYFSWENTYRPTYYTLATAANIAGHDSYNAYDHSVRRATASDASATFKFDGNSIAIWGLQKSAGNVANFSVALDGKVVAADLSNEGTSGTNACLFKSGILYDDGPHTLTITKLGASGVLDIGNAKVGYEASPLYNLARTCNAVDATRYTTGSMTALTDAIALATTVLNSATPAQDDVTAASDALTDAMNKLKLKASGAMITALQIIVDQMESTFPEADYTPGSWAPFGKALDDAKAILATPDAFTDADIDVVFDALLDASDKLVRIADKSGLKMAIDYAENILKPANVGKYIPASVANLEDVLSGAAIVYADADATQAKVDKANDDLLKAIGQVYEKGDKAGLQALVTLVSRYAPASYTPASWTAFTKALEDARAVIDNPNAVADSVNKAYAALSAAITGLTRKADIAALSASIALAQQIVNNIGDYVPSTVVGLAEELAAAKAALANPDASQAQVNAATASLNAKILAARLKPDLSGLLSATARAKAVEESLYTAESYKVLTVAVTGAEAILSLPDKATQADVDDATVAVYGAIATLVAKPPVATAAGNDGKNVAKTVIPKGKISKITASTKGKIVVKWTKAPSAAKVTGYQVQYRVKGASKWTIKTVSAKSASLTIKNLKKNKKYQIRVRAYRTGSATEDYGAWSAVKVSRK